MSLRLEEHRLAQPPAVGMPALDPMGINLPAQLASHPHGARGLWSGLEEQDQGLAEPARPSPLEACTVATQGAVSDSLGAPFS